MNCPTCGQEMYENGCQVTGGPVLYCPRCGTLKLCDQEPVVPNLVHQCRRFQEERDLHHLEPAGSLWRRLGIDATIGTPIH